MENLQGLGFAGAALGVILVLAVVALLIQAVFIHMAAGLVGLRNAGFGRAFKAAFIAWLLHLGLACTAGMVLGAVAHGTLIQNAVGTLVGVAAGTLGVKISYDEGLLKSFIAYILAFVLTVIVIFALAFGLAALGLFATGGTGADSGAVAL